MQRTGPESLAGRQHGGAGGGEAGHRLEQGKVEIGQGAGEHVGQGPDHRHHEPGGCHRGEHVEQRDPVGYDGGSPGENPGTGGHRTDDQQRQPVLGVAGHEFDPGRQQHPGATEHQGEAGGVEKQAGMTGTNQ